MPDRIGLNRDFPGLIQHDRKLRITDQHTEAVVTNVILGARLRDFAGGDDPPRDFPNQAPRLVRFCCGMPAHYSLRPAEVLHERRNESSCESPSDTAPGAPGFPGFTLAIFQDGGLEFDRADPSVLGIEAAVDPVNPFSDVLDMGD